MGTTASSENHRSPSYGVNVNPRLEYAHNKSMIKEDNVAIDAPSLVKLQHGTVRYRYLGEGQEPDISKDRIERPHEENDHLSKKHGYFYHAKLKDFSENADPSIEDSWKFCYVYKGAQRARQKKLYYVFGKGLKTNEQGFVEPNYKAVDETMEEPTTDKFYKIHGHMYYELEYLPQKRELPMMVEEVQVLGDGKVETDGNEVEVVVHTADSVQRVKRKLAVKMFKPATHFHVYHYGEELDRDALMSTFQPETQTWNRFKILLKPKGITDHRDLR